MKRILSILFSAMLVWSCAKEGGVSLVSFTDTGCGRETKAEGKPSELILEYSTAGLVVTHTNAWLNCSIKDGGIVCEVSLDGNVIRLRAYERDGQALKCVCPVERMTSTVYGLNLDTEYVLEYICGDEYLPINFRYEKGMKKVIDLDLFRK